MMIVDLRQTVTAELPMSRPVVRVFKPLAAVVVALLLGLAASESRAEEVTFATSDLWIETESGRHHFTVEVAETHAQMKRGLMFRTDLANDAGMLFDYETPREVAMWMKNTLVPLDMLFVDSRGLVQRVVGWTTPQSLEPIASHGLVRVVIELRGGIAARLGIGRGSRIEHAIFTPAPE